nr:hypothetical protein [Tanacetum cinerariifolium]
MAADTTETVAAAYTTTSHHLHSQLLHHIPPPLTPTATPRPPPQLSRQPKPRRFHFLELMSLDGSLRIFFEQRIASIKGYRGVIHVRGLEDDEEGLFDVLFKLESSLDVLVCPCVAAAKKRRKRKPCASFIQENEEDIYERWVHLLDMQVTLHDKRIVMQVTLHYEAIVMQVMLHDKRIVMQVTLHYEAIVMQVTLHDERIVILRVLSNLHDLFGYFMDYFWSSCECCQICTIFLVISWIISGPFQDDMLYSCLAEYLKHFAMIARIKRNEMRRFGKMIDNDLDGIMSV